MVEKERPLNASESASRRLKALEKFQTYGPLGVTAQDHRDIGSTPNPSLSANPGKRLVDVFTEAEVSKWLRGSRKGTAELRAMNQEKMAEKFERGFYDTIVFLHSIGRLPKAFFDYLPTKQ